MITVGFNGFDQAGNQLPGIVADKNMDMIRHSDNLQHLMMMVFNDSGAAIGLKS